MILGTEHLERLERRPRLLVVLSCRVDAASAIAHRDCGHVVLASVRRNQAAKLGVERLDAGAIEVMHDVVELLLKRCWLTGPKDFLHGLAEDLANGELELVAEEFHTMTVILQILVNPGHKVDHVHLVHVVSSIPKSTVRHETIQHAELGENGEGTYRNGLFVSDGLADEP